MKPFYSIPLPFKRFVFPLSSLTRNTPVIASGTIRVSPSRMVCSRVASRTATWITGRLSLEATKNPKHRGFEVADDPGPCSALSAGAPEPTSRLWFGSGRSKELPDMRFVVMFVRCGPTLVRRSDLYEVRARPGSTECDCQVRLFRKCLSLGLFSRYFLTYFFTSCGPTSAP